MHERLGVLAKRDYETIRAFAEKTRVLAENGRMALEKHIADHGC